MKSPTMIIFDYGHTLLYEPGWGSARGNIELLKYATQNPDNYTFEDVRKGAELIFGKHIESIRKMGYDICGLAMPCQRNFLAVLTLLSM